MPNSDAEPPRLVGLKETLIDTTKGAVQLAAVALSVAGSATQKVPYLGAISTVLTEVLKIIDEVDACKSAWKNVGSKIQNIQTVVNDFRSQCVSEGMTDEELPDMIKMAFKDFEVCLLKVITTINDCKPNSKLFADWARLVDKRSELKAAAKQCGNDVDSALSIFQAKLQIDLFKTIRDLRNDIGDLRSAVSPHTTLIANLNSTSASFLPPSPSIFYGRSVEVDHVVKLVLNHAPARVAIVGSGGIGKTSIALTSIHHPEVEKYFLNQRFFLSCEAVLTAESLALALLKLFGLSVDSSGSRSPTDILGSYAQSMTVKCLLCLDNFETPWDSDRDHVELLLAKIAVPYLTLIITSRDSDRPRGIKWTAPLLPPIQPLTDTISHGHDDFSLLLINAVDCIPLAVTLLSQLAESESAEALWASWETKSTKLVKSDGSAHRLNNLELSIELSLQGPRLRACPGLPESRIPEFKTSFKDYFGGIRSAIRVLKQCSLAYALEGFLRVLSPVRQYTQDHPDLATTLSTTLFTQMAELYFDLIPADDLSTTSSVVRENIQLEIGNITAVLDVCLTKYANVPHVVHKVLDFSDACQRLYVYDTRVLSKTASVAQAHGLKSQEAGCYHKKGQIHVYIGELPDAEKMLKTALDLHTEANDKLCEADDLQSLGELYTRLNRLKEAEQALKSALDLHTELNDRLGQVNALQSLGELYTRLDRLEEAERVLQSALDLHTEINAKLNLHTAVNDKLGQASDRRSLGELYTRLDRLEEAGRALQSALDLYTELNDRLGQANALQSLGELYTRLDRLEEAERVLQSALDLHTEINAKLSQANDLRRLGELYTRLDRLEEAERAQQSALDLHTAVNDKLGQASDLLSLGDLYTRLDRLEEAERALQSALDLHTGVNSELGQANDLQSLGELYTRLNRLEEAERVLQSALALFTEVNIRLGQANALQRLGRLYTRLNRLEEAEQALQSALDLHTEINVKLSQANDLQSLGELYIRLDRLEEAERAQQSALDLHTAVNDKLGQASDRRSLGELYTRLDRLEEAGRALQSALNLHTKVNDKLGQANDLQSLGKLHTRLDRLEEAERALQSALDLYTEVNERVGQANALQSLGELYTKLNRLEEAERALKSALNVYMKVGSSLGQGSALGVLGELYITQCKFTDAQDFLTRAMAEYGHAHYSDGQQWIEEVFDLLREKQDQIIPEPHEPAIPIDDTPSHSDLSDQFDRGSSSNHPPPLVQHSVTIPFHARALYHEITPGPPNTTTHAPRRPTPYTELEFRVTPTNQYVLNFIPLAL
ncbi:hypothetical protein DFH09DRAFT_1287732 [Mycena vulgaris]|nr:hypothetical protein DFH09DRAFT_1287732 [Mycena vulgaris]